MAECQSYIEDKVLQVTGYRIDPEKDDLDKIHYLIGVTFYGIDKAIEAQGLKLQKNPKNKKLW